METRSQSNRGATSPAVSAKEELKDTPIVINIAEPTTSSAPEETATPDSTIIEDTLVPATDMPQPVIPGLNPECLNSNEELKAELTRLFNTFKDDKSLSPYAGDIHQKRQALSRALDRLITDSKVPDTRKLELYDVAIDHEAFGHRSMPLLKDALTATARFFKSTKHPTPVMPTQSQLALIAGRNALISEMNATQSNKPKV